MLELNSAPQAGSLSAPLMAVVEDLESSNLSDYSVVRMTELMTRFTSYAERGWGLRSIGDIATAHIEAFISAPLGRGAACRTPSVATMHLRRSAIRLYFHTARQLGLCEGDPTLDVVLPPRSRMTARPLSDEEVVLCRSASLQSLTSTRWSAAWALAEATARTSEIPQIRVTNVDLIGGRVWLPGTNKGEERWGHPTAWGLTQLKRRIEVLSKSKEDDPLLLYRGNGSTHSSQATSCIAIKKVLTRAGLGSEPDVRPSSVTAWAGRKVHEETGCIEEVARRLGLRSLDGAARLIGWQWAVESVP